MKEKFYQQQQDLINLEELNKKLISDLKDKSTKITQLDSEIKQIKSLYSELDAEHKIKIEKYNKLLELQHEKELNSNQHQNNSVIFQQSEIDKELYEKQIDELNRELVYFMDLLGYVLNFRIFYLKIKTNKFFMFN